MLFDMSTSMDTQSSVIESGVHLPVYESITGDLLRQLEHASSVEPTSTDDEGEAYALFAAKCRANAVPDGSIVIVPLTPPTESDVLDFTFMASGGAMFIKLHETPRVRNTYGHVASYSVGLVVQPYPVGTLIKFPTTIDFVIAKPRLVAAIIGAAGAAVDIPTEATILSVKRPRPLDNGGELAEDAGEKPKGTYLQDLDDVRHFSRNKTDVAKRELDLNFVFRAMDKKRQDYCTSTDLILQTELYRSMLCEQGDTIPGDRHEAFMSCGIMSRVSSLRIFQEKEKLKSLLTGSVLIECSSDPTLTLEDFVTDKGEKICNRTTACPNNNVGIIQVLKNLQTVLQIVFSNSFATCLDVFINHLEGELRPIEAVAADFLRYSIELAVRKFFRIVRSVKGTALSDLSVRTPELCAEFLSALFAKIAADLSVPTTMISLDNYFRFKISRRTPVVAAITPVKADKPTVKSSTKSTEEPKVPPSKPCSGHLGSQLEAVRKDGRKYKCSHGKDCTYRHISASGKSNQKLYDIIASMPPSIRSDLKRAIDKRE